MFSSQTDWYKHILAREYAMTMQKQTQNCIIHAISCKYATHFWLKDVQEDSFTITQYKPVIYCIYCIFTIWSKCGSFHKLHDSIEELLNMWHIKKVQNFVIICEFGGGVLSIYVFKYVYINSPVYVMGKLYIFAKVKPVLWKEHKHCVNWTVMRFLPLIKRISFK